MKRSRVWLRAGNEFSSATCLTWMVVALGLGCVSTHPSDEVPGSPNPSATGGATAGSPTLGELGPVSGVGGSGSVEEQPIGGFVGAAGTGGSSGQAPLPGVAACSATTANANGYCWGSVAIGGGGFVSGVVMSKLERNLIYARTDVGGAYRWEQATESWLPLTDWVAENQAGLLGIESIALDPAAPSRVYMLAGIDYFDGGKTAILSSDDYGSTFQVHEVTAQFTAHGNGPGRQSGERLAVDPENGAILYTGTRENGLFRSADRGATWARVAALDVTTTPNGNGVAFVLFDARAGVLAGATRTIYAGVSRAGQDNLYVSLDAGGSWAAVPGAPTTYAPQRAALGPNGELFITYGNGAGPGPSQTDAMDRGELWKLDVVGGAWTDITPLRGANNRAFGGISVDPSNPSRLLATTINTYQEQPWGYGDRIFLSTDGGASWANLIDENRMLMDTNGMPWIEDHAIHWAGSIELDPFDPERAFVTSGNGIFMTKNLSAQTSTWAFSARGLEETVPLDAVSIPGGALVSVIGDYDGFVHDDPTQSPQRGVHDPAMGTTSGLAVAALAPERLARAGREMYISADGAQTWSEVQKPTAQTGGRLAYSADGAVLLWAAGMAAYRTADQGVSWSPVAGIAFATNPTADNVNANKFYAYDRGAGAFYVSNDAGQSFAPAGAVPAGGSRRIRVAPGVEGDIWVPLNGEGLTRSVTSGSSFQRVAGVDTCRAIGFGAPAPNQAFPATYMWGAANGGPRGIYRSNDAGASWQRINDDTHQYGGPGNGDFVIGDANVYGRVYMSSVGRGLVMGEWVGAE